MSSNTGMESSRMIPFMNSSPTPRPPPGLSSSLTTASGSTSTGVDRFASLGSSSTPFNLSYASDQNLLAAAQHYSNQGMFSGYSHGQ